MWILQSRSLKYSENIASAFKFFRCRAASNYHVHPFQGGIRRSIYHGTCPLTYGNLVSLCPWIVDAIGDELSTPVFMGERQILFLQMYHTNNIAKKSQHEKEFQHTTQLFQLVL